MDKSRIFTRINYQIKAEKVRLIDFDGSQIGIVVLNEALNKAEVEGMDLIEIAPQAKPPVCRIYPYDKFKYEQQRKLKESKKKQKEVEIKKIRIRPNIFRGDLDQKIQRINEFLGKMFRIKIVVAFRGRELAHKDIGFALINKVVQNLDHAVNFEREPKFEGRNLIVILTLEKGKK